MTPDLTLNPETVKQRAADIHTAYRDVEARAALCEEALEMIRTLLKKCPCGGTGDIKLLGFQYSCGDRLCMAARAVLAKARLPGEGA